MGRNRPLHSQSLSSELQVTYRGRHVGVVFLLELVSHLEPVLASPCVCSLSAPLGCCGGGTVSSLFGESRVPIETDDHAIQERHIEQLHRDLCLLTAPIFHKPKAASSPSPSTQRCRQLPARTHRIAVESNHNLLDAARCTKELEALHHRIRSRHCFRLAEFDLCWFGGVGVPVLRSCRTKGCQCTSCYFCAAFLHAPPVSPVSPAVANAGTGVGHLVFAVAIFGDGLGAVLEPGYQ